MEEYLQFLELSSSQITCRPHKQNVSFVEINDLCADEPFDLIHMIPRCYKCQLSANSNQSRHFISFKSITLLISSMRNMSKVDQQKIIEISQTKLEIISFLKSKLVRRSKYVSFYSELSLSNRIFLQKQNEGFKSLYLISETDESQFQRQKMDELKKCMKNPDTFQKTFKIQMTKQNLKILMNLKYQLLKSLRQIEIFLFRMGLKYLGKNFYRDLLRCDIVRFSAILDTLARKARYGIIESKLLAIKMMHQMIKMESKIQSINEYMTQFVKLYDSFSVTQSNTKFIVSGKLLHSFNFNIAHTTVVLRNPQLNYEKHYHPVQFQSQFCHIEDGQYIFKNEYRASVFCEQKIDEERNLQTMIGCEYHVAVMEKMCDSWNSRGQIVEITQPLCSKEKIFLRLRLNSEEFDKVCLRILWSSSLQNVLTQQKDHFIDIMLQIIPDQGNNHQLFGFTQKKKKNSSNFMIEKYSNSNNPCSLVLEDDIVSLFLNQEESKVVCWNESRNRLIKEILAQKPKINVQSFMEFQVQLYAALILYTTIPQVQIFTQEKK